MSAHRYAFEALRRFGAEAFAAAGMPADRAEAVAAILVEGDLLGHDTHGLALLKPYTAELASGAMAAEAQWSVISDTGPCAAWDGHRAPGPWLVQEALRIGRVRADQFGCFAISIGNSHHIACLAAYLEPLARAGYLVQIASSDPATASVAPFGSARRLYTPNPIAVGIPTSGAPMLIDVSMSATTNAMVTRTHQTGSKMPHPWLLDASGRPTDDPSVFFADPPGTIMPLGGQDVGHKGFALALMVEALTSGLAGQGRRGKPGGWGASVFVLVLRTELFGGRAAFEAETDHLVRAVAASEPIDPSRPPRIPGKRALHLKHTQLRNGVALNATIVESLKQVASKLGIPRPEPITA